MRLIRTVTIDDVKYVMRYPSATKRTVGRFVAADEIILALQCIFSTTPEIYAAMVFQMISLDQETMKFSDLYDIVYDSRFWAVFKALLGISHDCMFDDHIFIIFQCILQFMLEKQQKEFPKLMRFLQVASTN